MSSLALVGRTLDTVRRWSRLLSGAYAATRRPAERRPAFERLETRDLPSALSMVDAAPRPSAPSGVSGRRIDGDSRNVAPRAAVTSYLGFAFGPYVGQWRRVGQQQQPPPFNGYGSGNWSVQNQINLVGSRAGAIATYSAGYAGYYKPTTPWNQVDSAWMVGGAAANFNKRQGQLALTVSQGIFQQVQNGGIVNPLMNAEINGALQIARTANAVYPRTVQRLVFTNEYVTNAATTTQVDQLILKNKAAAQALGLKVGVRSNTFGQLTNSKSPYLAQLQKLVKDVDFIMLNIYPSTQTKGAAAAVAEVANQYTTIRAAALKLNPKIEVLIGETGWASQGISFNDLTGKTNTVANAQAYFTAIQKWANANKVQTFYFEAIDEPWKSNLNQTGGDPWTGPNGAEGHYGVWSYNASTASGQLVAKFPVTALRRG
jgi:exo-beta-1,3-glucanase (GH17 family)